MVQILQLSGLELHLLPEKVIYIPAYELLLVADLHLGKPETFQRFGIPIPQQVNHDTLSRLQELCDRHSPKKTVILGDLFHSKFSLVDEVLQPWTQFLEKNSSQIHLIIGNHDRPLVSGIQSDRLLISLETLDLPPLHFSHEPDPQENSINLCGHIHPCVTLKTRLDRLRLPCFYCDRSKQLLILPSFGAFTGSYEMPIEPGIEAYVIAENQVISLS
jgi:DNA ligase-associated metallophosphoesterase